jgi:hypothetical protein
MDVCKTITSDLNLHVDVVDYYVFRVAGRGTCDITNVNVGIC